MKRKLLDSPLVAPPRPQGGGEGLFIQNFLETTGQMETTMVTDECKLQSLNRSQSPMSSSILRVSFVACGHCPFPIQGTDEDGFRFQLPVVATWNDGEMDDIVYSPVKGETILISYWRPGYDAEEEIDEVITRRELYRRSGITGVAFTAFKLCDLLDFEDALEQVWRKLLNREYKIYN